MQQTDRSLKTKTNNIITIRIGRGTLSFSIVNAEGKVEFEPYTIKSGISMAANLREAFKTSDFLEDLPKKARIFVDSDVLMEPINLFEEEEAETLFSHAFPSRENEVVFYQVLPDLHAVAISSINKDLRLVLEDHFEEVTLLAAMSPVWHHMHQRSFTGNHRKLFGYFHEHRLEVFTFQQNRFKFFNSFDIRQQKDAVFFVLYIWKQLLLDARNDELHLVGNSFFDPSATATEEREELLQELRRFLAKIYIINPVADFNHAQVTEMKNMPYDLQTFYVKGK